MTTRLSYLDSFRALVMLMVVFCHTCNDFCLGCKEPVWLGRVFSITMLPGFFFVSGWFSHVSITGGVIGKRLTRMLLPTVLVFLLYVYAYWGGLGQIAYCASGEYKFGYWFTFALFLMNVQHYGVRLFVARWCGRGERGVLLAMGIVALALIVLKDWDWTQNGATLAQLVSLRLIAMHLPYYIMGMVCRRRQDVFHRIVNNDYVVGAVMVAFAIGVAHDGGGFWIGMIMGVLGVVLLYRMCYRYQNVFSDDTLAGRQLCMIGRNTLQIYLIHYFFFLGLKLPQLGAILDAPAMWVAKISVASVLAVAIAYGCIGVMKVVQMSKPLSRILIGK